jgi:hypothetical protein
VSDIIKLDDLKPIECWRRVGDAEDEAILTRTRRKLGALCSSTGFIGTIGSMLLLLFPTIIFLFKLIETGHPVLGALTAIFGFVATFVAGMSVMMRYLELDDRRRLEHLLEPQALSFTTANWERRERLLEEGEAFDRALGAFKALPAKTETDEVDAGVIANLIERRRALDAEVAAYVGDFRAATEAERGRVAAAEKARRLPRNPDKRRLAAFKERVGQLARLEYALDGLKGPIEAGVTVDVSPFVAARQFRAELETERERLVADGLKPKKLPDPPAASRKLLSATS